jgi:excisionase family DNA binding protein
MEKVDITMAHDLSTMGEQETSHPNSSIDPLWTVEDVAVYLKLQPETIRSMARRGELPALKIGKVWRFQKFALCEMLIDLD